MALTTEEAQIGKRVRLVRTEHRVSQRLAATQMGLSRDQLKRIETGEVAVRFFPAWNFCQFTDTNPLWLAFGDPERRFGFVVCANSNVREDAGFLEIMRTFGERYRAFRFLTHSSWAEGASVFSDRDSVLSAKFITLKQRSRSESPKKNLGRLSIKHYLTTDMPATPLTWEDLRAVLISKTESPYAKAHLAHYLRVTLAAISQWRTGASAPTADKTLQILAWIKAFDTKTKSAGSAETQPALKTRKRKARSTNAKPKSSQKKR